MAGEVDLAGRVAAVTGGARGIGEATVRALHRAGMRVAIGDLDGELARGLAARLGEGAVGLDLDVTSRASFAAFLDDAEAALGDLDVLVNNAGIMPLGRFVDEDDDTARRMVDINLHGVLLGMKLALPRMIARDRGHVVNLASVAGRYGSPGGATYAATKHAVVGATEAVRGELRHEGSNVRLSYLLPYLVDTELGRGTTTRARTFRLLRPEEVADAVVDAVRRGRVDVWLPWHAGLLHRLATASPRPVMELVTRVLRVDRVLEAPDAEARRAYEDRAAGGQ
jgi:NADP-dependent 3-hydroxy acid dehydrogenase YdfG